MYADSMDIQMVFVVDHQHLVADDDYCYDDYYVIINRWDVMAILLNDRLKKFITITHKKLTKIMKMMVSYLENMVVLMLMVLF